MKMAVRDGRDLWAMLWVVVLERIGGERSGEARLSTGRRIAVRVCFLVFWADH